ncbi:hypothetical protein AB9B79_26320, partial [Citrobacter freundii]
MSDNGRVREHQIDTLSVIADDTEQEIPAIIKCGDVFRVSQCHCQQRVFGESVVVVEMPEQGSCFVPESSKQVDIIYGAKNFIAEGRQCGGGQVEKGKTGGCRDPEYSPETGGWHPVEIRLTSAGEDW